jgi:hypothetical protein
MMDFLWGAGLVLLGIAVGFCLNRILHPSYGWVKAQLDNYQDTAAEQGERISVQRKRIRDLEDALEVFKHENATLRDRLSAQS